MVRSTSLFVLFIVVQVEDRNQEFKSDRADVREMGGGSLERLRGDIAEVARKLAAYVRARLERSRGRSGPDNGECTGPSKGRRGEVHGDG